MRSSALMTLLAALPVACSVPFRPYELACPLAADAFDVVCDQLRLRYGRLAVTDRITFRIQTDWRPFEERGRVMRRRATVFRVRDMTLAIVVEETLLTGNLLGEPHWTPPKTQASLERELAGAIEVALGA